MFTFTQSVETSKNVSQGTHHVRKSFSLSFPPTHLIVGARAIAYGTEGGGLVSRLYIIALRHLYITSFALRCADGTEKGVFLGAYFRLRYFFSLRLYACATRN